MGRFQNVHISVSRKMLSFFLIRPREISYDCDSEIYEPGDYKWINFPSKVDILIENMVNRKLEIAQDIVILIQHFAFGDDQYQYEQKIEFRKSRGSVGNYGLEDLWEYPDD